MAFYSFSHNEMHFIMFNSMLNFNSVVYKAFQRDKMLRDLIGLEVKLVSPR